MKLSGAAWLSVQQVINQPVVPGKTYKFGCTGYVEGGNLQIFIRKPGDNKTKYTDPIKTNSTESVHLSGTVTIPQGVTEVEVIMNKTDKQSVFIDDVYFIEITE